ncbi:MotA/TolQ/ExbB proton channel family protein [Neorhodopirellula pilleata]|uniref:MotA/TolQ/ExbB proton channel family protein n=1 Tax=Neorhodopirellula pilleata TaxID=2714738 RepID=UPI001E2A7C6F|nr:MotA/TolQ/ExbB proton channel family protein [Neorhodopirellula pilleata]
MRALYSTGIDIQMTPSSEINMPTTPRDATIEPASKIGNPPESRDVRISAGEISIIQKLTPLAVGLIGTGVFYAFLYAVNWAPLNRYFLGHPVAVAATTLFCIAVSILAFKAMQTASQRTAMRMLRDDDLMPPPEDAADRSPTEIWQRQNNAGLIARSWQTALAELPEATRHSRIVSRLDEILTRQSHRTTTGDLPEDLRELSIRDADDAHDSLGLIRIIVWAIPMLGFLGTVIGITQTLGGLDFTDGTAAVDRLKSGLYVAFDTTAIGLVLSVVAIFLQFPVERGQQSLLADIDARVRKLVSAGLPSDDPGDSQTELVTHLCRGIEVAIAQSLSTQAKLWQETIEEAQAAWRTQHQEGAEQFRRLLQAAMQPALTHHADRIEQTIGKLDGAASSVNLALREQTAAWRDALQETAIEVQTHRRTLLTHVEAMTTLATRQTQASEHEFKATDIDPAMAKAMTTLARAVDILSTRLPEKNAPRVVDASAANASEPVESARDQRLGRAA